MDLREIRYENADQIQLPQDKDKCLSLLNAVLNIRVT